MIKIEHLNKYYSKGAKNELHVIDDVSLELPDSGLVVILGKSGSGKTTLLNCIGGLDKATGKIDYGSASFSSYRMGLMDSFRSENVGYVFQNYLLLPDESVWRNVDIALSIYGIADKDERTKRINASLNSVGMGRYRRKDASALSGGQKQRVAIARALAKLPSIIIADEPTGNLDSENSLEVMDILREVATDRLVLLVTHSDNLAYAYADRVIVYSDGKIISDSPNSRAPSSIEPKSKEPASKDGLILSKMKKEEKDAPGVRLVSYSDEKETAPISLTLIQKDGESYLMVDSSKVHINDPSLKIIEPEKEETNNKNPAERPSSFDHSSFASTDRKGISFLSMLKRSFSSFFNGKKKFKTRFFRTICFFIGLVTSVISVMAYYSFYSNSYASLNSSLDGNSTLVVKNKEDSVGNISSISYDDYSKALIEKSSSGVKGLMVSAAISSSSLDFSKVSSSYLSISSTVSCYPLNDLAPHIVLGKAMDDPYTCVISKSLLSAIYPDISNLDFSSFIGRKILSEASYSSKVSYVIYRGKEVSPTIVGISDDSVPFIYLSKEGGIEFLEGYLHSHTGSTNYGGVASFLDNMSFYTRDEMPSSTVYTPISGASSIQSSINLYASKKAKALIRLYANVSNDTSINVLGDVAGDEAFAVFDDANDYSSFKTWFANNSANSTPFSCINLDKLNVLSGRLPTAKDEIILPYLTSGVEAPGHYDSDGKFVNYSIVGTYMPVHGRGCYAYTYPDTYTSDIFSSCAPLQYASGNSVSSIFRGNYGFGFYSEDIGKSVSYFKSIGYEAKTTFAAVNDANKAANNASGATSIAVELVVFAVILMLANLLSSRSNMIHHIYSISVYRSLGASKGFIYRLFTSDSLVNSLLTMETGSILFFIIYLIVALSNGIALVPFWIPLVVVLALVFFSLLGTWLPLVFLLAKTPHEISVKYDI